MNAKIILSAMIVSLFALAGCSTVPSTSQVANSHVDNGNDNERMSRVNRVNRSRGVETLWINPPRRQSENSDGGNN